MVPKGEQLEEPDKYRPITCLCTSYKILTACVVKKIYQHCMENNILAEEQKGYRAKTYGCKEQLIINETVMMQALRNNRNIHTAYIYDSVPHSWLLQVLHIYKVYCKTIKMLESIMAH